MAMPETSQGTSPHVTEVGMQTSDQIGDLAAALAKARKSFKPVKRTCKNPFYHSTYADLSELIDATKDALADGGLVVVQSLGKYDPDKQTISLTTLIAHASGQWIKDELTMPVPKVDPQGVGSATTYARRYAYGAALNIASESDDDGNAVSSPSVKPTERKQAAPESNVAPKPNGASQGSPAPRTATQGGNTITEKQQRMVRAKAGNKGLTEDGLRNLVGKRGYEHLAEVPMSAVNELLAEIDLLA